VSYIIAEQPRLNASCCATIGPSWGFAVQMQPPGTAAAPSAGGFWYLATPYTRYRAGHEKAAEDAAREAARLMDAGVEVFSPIAHTHPISKFSAVSNTDPNFWLDRDQPFMDAAKGLIVCMLDGWDESSGVEYEIYEFTRAGKPIVFMIPGVVPARFPK
jgi:hypothetical protein